MTRLRPAAPEELARIVEQLLRKDRDARYASAEALLADLRVLKTGLTAEKQDVAVLRLKKARIYPGAPMADNASPFKVTPNVTAQGAEHRRL